jgi:5-methylcytosine-specific restriction endonuclease McrA
MTAITGGVANHEGVDVTKTTCPVCDREFEAKGNRRFCPPSDSERSRGLTRSWCAKRYERHISRGAPLKGQPPAPFDCAQCGTHCVQGKDGVDLKARKFCSTDCKKAWHHVHIDGHRTAQQRERDRRDTEWERRRKMLTAEPSRTVVAQYRKALRCDPCPYCGEPSESVDHIVPSSMGGEDSWENMAGTCRRCNSIKGALPLLSALLWAPVCREYHDQRRRFFC